MPKTGSSMTQYLGSDPVQGQDVISKFSFVPYWSCCICHWTADVSTGTLPTVLLFPMTAFHSINFYNRHVYQPQRHIYRQWQESFKVGVWAFRSWHKHFHKIVFKNSFLKISATTKARAKMWSVRHLHSDVWCLFFMCPFNGCPSASSTFSSFSSNLPQPQTQLVEKLSLLWTPLLRWNCSAVCFWQLSCSSAFYLLSPIPLCNAVWLFWGLVLTGWAGLTASPCLTGMWLALMQGSCWQWTGSWYSLPWEQLACHLL